MSVKLHVCAADGTILYDGLSVDWLTTDIIVPLVTGAKNYRITRSIAPVTTAGGSTVRVYCEPSDPPPPH